MILQAHTGIFPETGMSKLELREWDSSEVETYAELLKKHHYLAHL